MEDRPCFEELSVGRIYANIKRFIDPIDFENKSITVLGIIKGTEPGKIKNLDYNFLVIDVDPNSYQFWSNQEETSASNFEDFYNRIYLSWSLPSQLLFLNSRFNNF